MPETNAQNLPEFIRLNKLIEERKVVEAALLQDNQILSDDVKTDINFSDIHHKTLLDYAAECGDIKTVNDLLQKDAKVTNNAIISAVNNHRFELADLLYENVDSCLDVSLIFDLKTKNGREWLRKKIQDDLSRNVDEKRQFAVISQNSKFLQTKDPENSNNKASHELTPLQGKVLNFYAKANNWNYFDYLTTKTKLKIPPVALGPLLMLALQYARIDKAKQILNLIDALPDAQQTYIKSHALLVLLKFKAEDKWDYLLAKGAKLNTKLGFGDTLLAAAIDGDCQFKQEIDAIRYLINKGADITALNYFGQSILHLAAKRGDETILALIESLPFPKDFKELRDIFGCTAKDYCDQNQNQQEKDISIDQEILCKQLSYFLKLERCQVNSVWESGVCNGLSRLFHLYPEDYFYSTLKLINAWDGEIENLFRPFPAELPQSKYYQNLYQLMKAWTNHISAYQAEDLSTDLSLDNQEIAQEDRVAQHKLLTDEPDQLPIFIHKFSDDYRGYDKLMELLNYFYKMPPNARADLYDTHSTTLYTAAEHTVHYYDCNFSKPVTPVVDKLNFLNLIQNAKFKCYEDKLATPSIPNLEFNIYFHQEDEMQFSNTSFRLLSRDELPKNKQEALDFQNRSANHFTPLHIAIIGRDLVMLEQLLKDGHCDLDAIDTSYRDPLYLAGQSNFLPAIELILKYRALQNLLKLTTHEDEKNRLIKAFHDNQPTANHMLLLSMTDNLVLIYKITKSPIYLQVFKNLLEHNDLDQNLFTDIFKMIATLDEVDKAPLFSALLEAAFKNKIDLNQLIQVKVGTSLFFKNYKQCYPIIYAVKYCSPQMLKSLIAQGINIDVKNNDSKSAREEIKALKNAELSALLEKPSIGLLSHQKT